MCRIQVAVLQIFFQAPHIGVAIFVKIQINKVMYVSTFCMNYFAKQSLPRHIKRKQFKKIVAAVFKHHAMLLCFLRSIYQLPALIEGKRRRNFCSRMLALLHGIHRYRRMQMPGRTYVYEVNIRSLTHGLPSFLTTILNGFFSASLFEYALCFGCAIRIFIA